MNRHIKEYLRGINREVFISFSTSSMKSNVIAATIRVHEANGLSSHSPHEDGSIIGTVTEVYSNSLDAQGFLGKLYTAQLSAIEPKASVLFPIGTGVLSTIGSSWFVVTGYEEETNRVVVVSQSCFKHGVDSKERRRYSYKTDELMKGPTKEEVIPDEYHDIKIGERYVITKKGEDKVTIVQATADPSDKGFIQLVGVGGALKGLSYRYKWLHGGKLSKRALAVDGIKII